MHVSWSSAEMEDREGSGKRSRRLVVCVTCILPMRIVAERRELLTHTGVGNADEEEEQRRT